MYEPPLVSGFFHLLYLHSSFLQAANSRPISKPCRDSLTTIVEIDGKAHEVEKKLKMKLVVKDDGYKIYFDKHFPRAKASLSFNSSKNPKTLDALFKDGPNKGKVRPAILSS